MKHLLTIWLLIAALMLPAAGFADVRPDEMRVRETAAKLTFHYPERYEPAVDKLEGAAVKSLRKVSEGVGLEDLGDIEVWVLPEVDDYFEVTGQPGSPPEWAIGLSLSNKGVIIVVNGTGQNGVLVDLEKTFVHELAHVAIDRARAGQPFPRWYNEGYALHAGEEWTPERAETLARAATAGTIRSFRELDRGFPAHHMSASAAYSQSFHFVAHLERMKGDGVHAEILGRVRDGDSFEDAFRKTFGSSLAVVEAGWRTDLESSMSGWSMLNDGMWGFFGASLLFIVAWLVRRKRAKRKLAAMGDDPGGWDYDESRYPLPGAPRQS